MANPMVKRLAPILRSFRLFFCISATTKVQATSLSSGSSSSSSRRRRYWGLVQKVSARELVTVLLLSYLSYHIHHLKRGQSGSLCIIFLEWKMPKLEIADPNYALGKPQDSLERLYVSGMIWEWWVGDEFWGSLLRLLISSRKLMGGRCIILQPM